MSRISAELRKVVVLRAGNRCEYCRLSQESQVGTFPVDHVIPVALAGPTETDNLALACQRCNAEKWSHVEARDNETGQVESLFNPRLQLWTDHFQWSATDSTMLEPLTPTGRTTIALLKMNSSQHRTVRTLLAILGLHPPSED